MNNKLAYLFLVATISTLQAMEVREEIEFKDISEFVKNFKGSIKEFEQELDKYLEAGFDINSKGTDGLTPLDQAALNLQLEQLKLLLDKKANPNIGSPFLWALENWGPQLLEGKWDRTHYDSPALYNIFKALLEHDARPNSQDLPMIKNLLNYKTPKERKSEILKLFETYENLWRLLEPE